VNLIFGAVIDPNMKDDVRITVIATGFERTGMPRRVVEQPVNENRERPATSAPIVVSQPAKEFQPRAFNTEDLDIPTFLRNRSR
jgi:cell division protein FtsZ